MADFSNTSFIPKQNPVKNIRRAASRQVYLLTIVSYLMLISSLIATVALFAYDRHTQKVLASEIESLSNEIDGFNAEDMEAVIDLNERLVATEYLLDMNISLRALLAIIEDSTIDTVQFEKLTFSREDAMSITLEATIITDSFDSVLFQREIYEQAKNIKAVSLENVSISLADTNPEAADSRNTVSFSALFTINPEEALFVPDNARSPAGTSISSPLTEPVVATTTVPAVISTTSTTTP